MTVKFQLMMYAFKASIRMCVSMCACACMPVQHGVHVGARGQFPVIVFFFLPVCFQGLNSDHRAQLHEHLITDKSRQPNDIHALNG